MGPLASPWLRSQLMWFLADVIGLLSHMWAHSHLLWFLMPRYSQLMWSRKTDVIGSCDLCYQAATLNASIAF